MKYIPFIIFGIIWFFLEIAVPWFTSNTADPIKYFWFYKIIKKLFKKPKNAVEEEGATGT